MVGNHRFVCIIQSHLFGWQGHEPSNLITSASITFTFTYRGWLTTVSLQWGESALLNKRSISLAVIVFALHFSSCSWKRHKVMCADLTWRNRKENLNQITPNVKAVHEQCKNSWCQNKSFTHTKTLILWLMGYGYGEASKHAMYNTVSWNIRHI